MFAKKLLKEILMANKFYHELIDEEWKIVEKILPPEKKGTRCRKNFWENICGWKSLTLIRSVTRTPLN